MLDMLFWVSVGAFIGWNFPQPFWAVYVQNKLVSTYKSFTNKE